MEYLIYKNFTLSGFIRIYMRIYMLYIYTYIYAVYIYIYIYNIYIQFMRFITHMSYYVYFILNMNLFQSFISCFSVSDY